MLGYWCLLSEGGESSIASATVAIRHEQEIPNRAICRYIVIFFYIYIRKMLNVLKMFFYTFKHIYFFITVLVTKQFHGFFVRFKCTKIPPKCRKINI